MYVIAYYVFRSILVITYFVYVFDHFNIFRILLFVCALEWLEKLLFSRFSMAMCIYYTHYVDFGEALTCKEALEGDLKWTNFKIVFTTKRYEQDFFTSFLFF